MRGTVFVASPGFARHNAEPLEVLAAQSFPIRKNPHERRLGREDYATMMKDVSYVVADLEPYDSGFFETFPGVRALSRVGVGLDSIDLAAARARGVRVYNTPDAPARSVAEHAVALILSLLRRIPQVHEAFHAGRWEPEIGLELAGKTVGLLGFGRIGRLVAARLTPFEARLIAFDTVWDEEAARRLSVERRGFEEVLGESDILSIHLPLLPATRGLLDAGPLARMKPGAFLVNTARGGILDDASLIERLRAGRLAGAALDVFEDEPNPERYRNVPRLIATPHVGSHTIEGRYRMEMGAVRNLIAYVEATERGVAAPEDCTGNTIR